MGGYVQPPAIPNGARFDAPATPAGWLRNNVRAWWNGAVDTIMRGQPAPYADRDRYPRHVPPVNQPAPFGGWQLALTRRFDRGAYAYGLRGGALTYDPIGPGVLTTRPMDPTAPAAVKVPVGDAIFWEPQSINYAVTPASGAPIYTPGQLAVLMGNPALAGGSAAGNVPYVVPPSGGFGS